MIRFNLIFVFLFFISINLSAQESCNGTDDLDNDGLYGCADPDCAALPDCSNTFQCTDSVVFYQVIQTSEFVRYNLSDNSYESIYTNSYYMNAMGYNVRDGFIYGIRTGTNHLVQVGNDGVFIDLGSISGLPQPGNGHSYYLGDCNLDGDLFVADGNQSTVHKINIENQTSTPIYTSASPNLNMADFSFLSTTGLFYGINRSNQDLYSFNPTNGDYNNLGDVGLPTSNDSPFGASYADASGNLYFFANNTGILYLVDSVDMTSLALDNTGIILAGNDGASCPLSSRLGHPTAVAPPVEDKKIIDVTIFPNPSNGIFSFKSDTEENPDNIAVYDMLGKRVYFNENVTTTEIVLDKIPTGTYFIQITYGDIRVTKKIIVTKPRV